MAAAPGRKLKVLAHLPDLVPAPRLTNPGPGNPFPAPLLQIKLGRCDLLHRAAPCRGVNVPNGPENKSRVRPRTAARPRNRLHPDRRRGGCRADRAGLPASDLTKAERPAQTRPHPWMGLIGPRKGSAASRNFGTCTTPAAAFRQTTSSRILLSARIHTRLCGNRA